ncbi:MAG TPA: TonB-dependent receptor [Chitinophagaceae bacterium]|jgi:outer membrane receptor protein involved in Fe transport|nr:TonB-dependent receptor [Chitinophagaceae bacterium]
MKKLLSLWIMFGISFSASSQLTIQSKLMDSVTNLPIAYATISVYQVNNLKKPIQNITSAEDGSFQIQLKDTGDFQITIQHAGYQEIKLKLQTSIPPVIFLLLKIKNMTAVTVTAKKPLIEKTEDKIIFNVEADASLDGLMATDALEKTPFVSVDADGNVQLKGGSDFKVLLNGKESSLFAKNPSEALKSFPASSIKRIEIITNPSVKYDAEGSTGIINIITKRKPAGYNASTELYYNTYHTYNSHNILNLKAGKIGFAGNASTGLNNSPAFTTQTATEALNPVTYSKRILNGTTKGPGRWYFVNTEMNYDIDSLKNLSIYSNSGNNKRKRYQERTSSVIGAAFPDTTENVFIDTSSFYYPWGEVGMDYVQKFKDSSEKEWSIKTNYNYSRDHSTFNSDQFYTSYNRFSINDSYSKNKQLTIQTDLILPLRNKQKFETGAKAIFRNASAVYEALLRYDQAKDFELDSFNTDNFRYRQDIYSAYILYSYKINQWSFRIGSRVEHTEVKTEFASSASTIKQSYTHFIPALSISKKINESSDISFSYTQRLRRPYIWDLNPFVNNSDSLNLNTGNPALIAEVTHSFEIGYGYYKNGMNLSLKLSENYCNNQITSYSFFNSNTGILLVKPDNIGRNLYTGLNGNISVPVSKMWTVSLNNGIQYYVISNKKNTKQKNEGFSGFISLVNNITIYKNLKGAVSGSYSKPGIQLQGQSEGYFSYGFSINNKFFKNKIQLSMGCAYPFQSKRSSRSFFRDENFIQSSVSKYQAFRMGFSIRWNFGKLTENVGRKRNTENNVNTEN